MALIQETMEALKTQYDELIQRLHDLDNAITELLEISVVVASDEAIEEHKKLREEVRRLLV